MRSLPYELLHKETGEIKPVYALGFYYDEIAEILLKNKRTVFAADPEEWDVLTVTSEMYQYSMSTKQISKKTIIRYIKGK